MDVVIIHSMHSASKMVGYKLHFPNWYIRPPPTHNVNPLPREIRPIVISSPLLGVRVDIWSKKPGPDWSPKRNRGSAQKPGIPQVGTNWNAQQPTSCNQANLKWERCHVAICRNHRCFWPYMLLPKRSPKTKTLLAKAPVRGLIEKNNAAMRMS